MCKTHNSQFGTCSANPPRGAKNTQASRVSPGGLLGQSWGLMWPIWEPSGGNLGAIWWSCGKLKKAYKTFVKHTILYLGHALLTHHEAPRIHKLHECHLDGSWDHLGASCCPPGSHLGAIWGPSGGHLGHLGVLWGPSRDFMGAFWQFKNMLG